MCEMWKQTNCSRSSAKDGSQRRKKGRFNEICMLKVTRYVNNELALISIPLNRTYLRETQETVFAMQSVLS